MDGFRDRLSGRYDRSSSRGDRYDRPERVSDDRYDRPERLMDDRYDRSERMDDRYDRGARRQPEPSVSAEVISEAVEKSNRNQLDIIADMFDEAKADRLESERAIISAISDKLAEQAVQVPVETVEAPVEEVVSNVVASEPVDNEALNRVERMVSQNAESLSENGEILERSYNSLRSNIELLNDIKGSIGDIQSSQEDIKSQTQYLAQNISQSVAASMQSAGGYGQGSDMDKEEIISAIGDNRSLLNMIRQDIINSLQKTDIPEEDIEEKAEVLTAQMAEKYYKDLEEHIHKECVKCYRNVESKLEEQSGESFKKLEKTINSMSSVSMITLISNIVLNVITIGILVCVILGILSF